MLHLRGVRNLIYAVFISLLSVIFVWHKARSQDFRVPELKNEIAKMVCQIQPRDRSSIAVMELRVDRKDLQDCIGKPITEAIIEVLWKFHFTLVERGPFYRKMINQEISLQNSPLMDTSTIAKLGKRIGAKSILTGNIKIGHKFIHVVCRITKVETMAIMGLASCKIPKKDFQDCLLLHELDPPIVGFDDFLPKPRKRY